MCSDLIPVISGLTNKLGDTLSEVERSKINTERYLHDYGKVGVVIDSIKSQEQFNRFCDILKQLKHETWAETLRLKLLAN